MQIKTNQATKKFSNTDLVRRWLEMTLPPITGFIVLPYVFLFLGSLYTEEFHSIPAHTLYQIVGIQAILIIATPIVTAWITLRRVSHQLQILAQAIAKSADKIGGSSFINDSWVSLEKQQDDLGLAARQIKDAFLEKQDNVPDSQDSDYSSLFTLSMHETNTQMY